MRTPLLLSAFAATALMGGCSIDTGFTRRTYNDLFFQEARAEVDILFVVDNSESMEAEQERLARRFDTFIAYMDDVETLMDLHLGAITTDLSDDNPERAAFTAQKQFA